MSCASRRLSSHEPRELGPGCDLLALSGGCTPAPARSQFFNEMGRDSAAPIPLRSAARRTRRQTLSPAEAKTTFCRVRTAAGSVAVLAFPTSHGPSHGGRKANQRGLARGFSLPPKAQRRSALGKGTCFFLRSVAPHRSSAVVLMDAAQSSRATRKPTRALRKSAFAPTRKAERT